MPPVRTALATLMMAVRVRCCVILARLPPPPQLVLVLDLSYPPLV